VVHPHRDPGCLSQSLDILTLYRNTYLHALVLFDREGSGQEHLAREQLEDRVEQQLNTAGWQGQSRAIVLDPELEVWLWNNSPHVALALGWRDTKIDLRQWLVDNDFPTETSTGKPRRPKEAVETVLRHVRKPRSSAIYREIAEKVSLTKCGDVSFLRFRQILQSWFPQ
jgi:hypothetical protein